MIKVTILGNSWHGKWSQSLFQTFKKYNNVSVRHLNVRFKSIKTGVYFIDKYIKKIITYIINIKIKNSIIEKSYYIIMTPDTILQETWKLLKQKNVILVAWLGDDPFRKGKASMYLPFFDHVFVIDRSWIKNIQTFNSNVSCLPHAFSKEIFFPIEDCVKKYDVMFVGDSFKGEGDGLYRANLLKALHDNGISISLFGDKGWLSIAKQDQYIFLKRIYKGPIKKIEDLNKAYNQSHIVLNIHHRQVRDGANQRIFEASGSLAFQISDKQNLIQDLFEGSIPMYSDKEELIQKILYFLNEERERLEKAKKAHRKAQENTYDKRIYALLNFK